jgi:hypothetical protein
MNGTTARSSDVLLAMVMCSLFLKEVPMQFREKVVLCLLIMKYMDMYIKSESDLIWVNNQIKKMEEENYKGSDVDNDKLAICGTGSPQRDRTSDE